MRSGSCGRSAWRWTGSPASPATRHEWELGARLLACSERLARGCGYLQSPHERRLRGSDEQRLRTALGRRDFERATSEGQLLSTGDAVTAALAFVQRFT